MPIPAVLRRAAAACRPRLVRLAVWAAPAILFLIASVGLLWTKPVVPGFLVLAVLLTVAAGLETGRLPLPDRWLAGLAAALTAWSGLTASWAIVPAEAVGRMLSLILLFALVLPLFSAPVAVWLDRSRERLLVALGAGLAVGWTLLAIEHRLEFPLHRLFHGLSETAWQDSSVENLSVHNRGVTYLAVLAWPVAAFLAGTGRRGAIAAAVAVALALIGAQFGSSTAAVLGLIAGIGMFGLARWRPRLMRGLLAAAVVLMAALAPVALPALYQALPRSGGHIPHSFHHRLEIYDFTAARIAERPWTGWGLDNARYLPINEEDLPGYRIFDRPPTHPHNAFLQVRVETGLPGLVLLTLLVLAILGRTARLAEPVQPFALAAFTTILCIAAVSYSLWSSSWLIIMVNAAFAFFALPARPPAPEDRS